ncbi:MAG TPA: FAD-dependent oxidoreductase [Vicinamibacterales bacterium]|nr:FAD-dependent oxidoreductase [Vicinamibacterales bacterium]
MILRVKWTRRATPTARRVALDLAGARFPFAAGQWALLGSAGQPLRRPYSIASAPEDTARTGEMEFLIKTDETGGAGPHLPALRRGLAVAVEGPKGRFIFPKRLGERHVLFVAGGTGIAPIRAMLRHALAVYPGLDLAVIYSARSPADLAYRRELDALARAGRIRLMLTVTGDAGRRWRGERGRINLARLQAMLADRRTLCFVCGPPSLVAEVPPLLERLGVARTRIRREDQ